MTISAYELNQALSKSFKVSFESEQDIEIETDTVVINSASTVDGELEELTEDVAVVNTTADSMDDVDDAVESLESLIVAMESSVLTGGFDKRSATLANLSLESITNRFGLESNILSFGMEAVEDDAEAETKSSISKAKQMIGALKSNTGALVNKMYMAAASALNNTTALSAKLVANATALKNNINAQNTGNNAVTLSRGVKRRLTIDGTTVLKPDEYVKELKRLVDKYNNTVKVYADGNVLTGFVTDVAASVTKYDGEPSSKKSIVNAVKSISEGMTAKTKSPDDVEAAKSAPYLGGATLALKRPSRKAVEDALFGSEVTSVSQEGIGRATAGAVQTVLGALLFTGSLVLCFKNGTVIGSSIFKIVNGNIIGGMAGVGVGIVVMYLLDYGVNKGMSMMASGATKSVDEINKLRAMSKSKLSSNVDDAVALTTEFTVESTSVSTESDETVSVTSLSAKQVAEVATIVQQTAATTQTMKAQLNKRKALMKQIELITKEMNNTGDETTVISTSAHAFVKQFIKQTIKFEMDLTSYSVGVMKAALAYAEASNTSSAAASTDDSDEKKA